MNIFPSIFYLLVCVAGSNMLTRWATSTSGPANVVLRCMTWMAVFFTSFFGGFFIVGYINIITDLPVVDPLYASVVALVVFIGFRLWLAKRVPGLGKEEGNTRRSHNFAIQLSLPGNGVGRTLAMGSIVIFVLIALMLSA